MLPQLKSVTEELAPQLMKCELLIRFSQFVLLSLRAFVLKNAKHISGAAKAIPNYALRSISTSDPTTVLKPWALLYRCDPDDISVFR